MSIRRLTPADATRYRALMLEAYAAHPDAFTSTASERAPLPLGWWEARLGLGADDGSGVWGDFEAERLIGVVGLTRETRAKISHKATLFGMYVDPGFRGRGVGDALVEELLRYARSRDGLAVVQLTVTDGNRAARDLYERHGFVAFGVEPYAFRVADAFVAKVHMWRRLEALAAASLAHPKGTHQE
jgi:ribosomal protein S18 acetylase RimI-like enzyme